MTGQCQAYNWAKAKDTFEPLEQRSHQALQERGASQLHIDLLVVTHIDNDHLEGILELLNRTQHELDFGDVWFNGSRQLANLPEPTPAESRPDRLGGEPVPRPDLLGLKEADQWSRLLDGRTIPWNEAFKRAAITIPLQGALATWELEGGLLLTVLGPPIARLRRLAQEWKQAKSEEPQERYDLLGPKDEWPPVSLQNSSVDASRNNGASIVLLAEYGGQSLLLAGDAYAGDIEAGLIRLIAERNLGQHRFPLTAFKLPHHGSARNLSRELLKKLDCAQYLISTNGSGNSKHPDQQALLRVLKFSSSRPCLAFNYASATTRNWHDRCNDVTTLGIGSYDTRYANDSDRGLVLKLA